MKTKFFYPVFIIFAGLLIYSNSLWNNFLWDDTYQIKTNPFVHSPKLMPLFFVSSIEDVGRGGQFLDYYYKPLLFSAYSILYWLGNGTPLIFHLAQISFHLTNSILLFYLFKRSLSQNLSFALALIFLVHPANEETVVYIANLQDVMFFFFGLVALLAVSYRKFSQINRLRLVTFLLLMSLLSKESGLLFVAITFLFIAFFESKLLVRSAIFFIFLIIFYSLLRIVASQIPLLQHVSLEISDQSLTERIKLIPKLGLFYLLQMIVPTDSVYVGLKLTDNPFIYELILITGLLSAVCLLIYGMKIVWKSKYFYPGLLFLIWFASGLAIHLQIFPLDALSARRWLYFPLAGAVGFLGVMLTRWQIEVRYPQYLFLLLALIISIFAMQTYSLNIGWIGLG